MFIVRIVALTLVVPHEQEVFEELVDKVAVFDQFYGSLFALIVLVLKDLFGKLDQIYKQGFLVFRDLHCANIICFSVFFGLLTVEDRLAIIYDLVRDINEDFLRIIGLMIQF